MFLIPCPTRDRNYEIHSHKKSARRLPSGVGTGAKVRRYRKHDERSESMLTYRTNLCEVTLAAIVLS